ATLLRISAIGSSFTRPSVFARSLHDTRQRVTRARARTRARRAARDYPAGVSTDGLRRALALMVSAGVPRPARETFALHYRELESGGTGVIREDTIEPLGDPVLLADVEATGEEQARALSATAVLKLNGG